MEKWLKLGMFSALLLGMLFSSFVVATAEGTMVNNIGGASTGARAIDDAAGTGTALTAGTIYHLDLNGNSTTNYWAGVWGNVSGDVVLRASTGEIFMLKAMTLPGPESSTGQGVRTLVFAYNVADGVPNFGALNAVPRSGGSIDTVTGVPTSLTDSATSLFTTTSFANLVTGNKTINGNAANSAWGARVFDSVAGTLISSSSLFMTMALNDGTNNLLFVTNAYDPYVESRKIFDNVTFAHYQMLLYVNNSGTANAQNYEFFLELR